MTYTLEQLENEPTTISVRRLEDGRVLCLRALLFGVQLTVSTEQDLAHGLVTDAWDYGAGGGGQHPTLATATFYAGIEFREWTGEGEPRWWTRHAASGRRRPGGDEAREYVRH